MGPLTQGLGGGMPGLGFQRGRVHGGAVQDLIDELGRLPGVGPKGAQRIAFHLLAADRADVRRLVRALTEVKERCGSAAGDT